jgi:integrase
VSPPTLKELLKYRRQVTHEADDPLFRSERSGAGDGRLTGHGMRGLLGRIANRAGLPKLTAHAFRRGCATMALRAGMNALHLQGMLGHTTLEMVRRYAQAVDDDLQAAHAAHSPVQSWLK